MKRGDPIYRLVLREDIRLGGMLAYKQRIAPVVLRAVLASLLSHASAAGRCWPSHATIAEEAELSEPSVRRALQALANAGLVRRTRRAYSKADATGERTTVYQLDWAKLEALAGLDTTRLGRCSDGSPKALSQSAKRCSDRTTNHSDLNQGDARAKAVRARKDCGDGPDDDDTEARVPFTEAIRRIAAQGAIPQSLATTHLGRIIDTKA